MIRWLMYRLRKTGTRPRVVRPRHAASPRMVAPTYRVIEDTHNVCSFVSVSLTIFVNMDNGSAMFRDITLSVKGCETRMPVRFTMSSDSETLSMCADGLFKGVDFDKIDYCRQACLRLYKKHMCDIVIAVPTRHDPRARRRSHNLKLLDGGRPS